MKRVIFLSALLFAASVSLLAQLKVRPNGKVVVGQEIVGDDPLNLNYKFQVYGNSGQYRHGGKLGFGDAKYNPSVFVGEYSNYYDTDELWLHGYNGVYITAGDAIDDLWLAAYYSRGLYEFCFMENVSMRFSLTVGGVNIPSDTRLKTNVKSLGSSLLRLRKLNGVSYRYSYEALKEKDGVINEAAQASKQVDGKVQSKEQEMQDRAMLSAERRMDEKRKKACEKERLGFIAQDLQKVFPELVTTDSSGYLSVDYISLIPVIVEALKEQQSQIDEQKKLIENLVELVGKDNPIAKQLILTKNSKH